MCYIPAPPLSEKGEEALFWWWRVVPPETRGATCSAAPFRASSAGACYNASEYVFSSQSAGQPMTQLQADDTIQTPSTPTSRTFAVATLGCKVNQADSEAIGEQFRAAGFEQRDFADQADVYVINT